MWKFVVPRIATGHGYGKWSRLRIHPRHMSSFLFAVATVATLQPMVTFAEVMAVKQKTQHLEQDTHKRKCPVYGCPLLPQDIYYDEMVRDALATIRAQTRKSLHTDSSKTEHAMTVLESSGDQDMATLTLIGYKGGPMYEQVNQDRAFVVAPFRLAMDEAENPTGESKLLVTGEGAMRRLMGVFDGHANFGELVSEYSVSQLPKLLATKLDTVLRKTLSEEQTVAATKQALIETFVELDKTAPAETSGGCTASVILQLDSKLFVANAGDSRSFIAVYHKQSGVIEIVYISREDKPHLPDERARVEAMGGQVFNPSRPGATSRVMFIDPRTGFQNGLAMSRSIGDWVVGKLGVIPDPIVDVIDIPELVKDRMGKSTTCVVIDEHGQMRTEPCTDRNANKVDDVHIFAVSATDGMMDYLSAEAIAETLAASLFDDDGPYLLSACESLISAAAAGWQNARQGRYRDDIAIAVSKIRIPPSS